MKGAWRMLFGLVAVLGLVVAIQAADKEETLKGTITCAKCDLKIQKGKCATVIVVAKEKDKKDKEGKDKESKDTIYYFVTDSHKEYHSDICKMPKKGTVTGEVSEKDGKKWIKVSKLEYEKEKKDK